MSFSSAMDEIFALKWLMIPQFALSKAAEKSKKKWERWAAKFAKHKEHTSEKQI